LQFRQIFLPLSRKAFAGSLEFTKRFILVIIQYLFLKKLPVPLNQIQIRREWRQKYQFNLRPTEMLLQQTLTIVSNIVNNDINHARNDEIFPVQPFFLWTTYNPSYTLFVGHKPLFD